MPLVVGCSLARNFHAGTDEHPLIASISRRSVNPQENSRRIFELEQTNGICRGVKTDFHCSAKVTMEARPCQWSRAVKESRRRFSLSICFGINVAASWLILVWVWQTSASSARSVTDWIFGSRRVVWLIVSVKYSSRTRWFRIGSRCCLGHRHSTSRSLA